VLCSAAPPRLQRERAKAVRLEFRQSLYFRLSLTKEIVAKQKFHKSCREYRITCLSVQLLQQVVCLSFLVSLLITTILDTVFDTQMVNSQTSFFAYSSNALALLNYTVVYRTFALAARSA
jgi:hypothetical protein